MTSIANKIQTLNLKLDKFQDNLDEQRENPLLDTNTSRTGVSQTYVNQMKTPDLTSLMSTERVNLGSAPKTQRPARSVYKLANN